MGIHPDPSLYSNVTRTAPDELAYRIGTIPVTWAFDAGAEIPIHGLAPRNVRRISLSVGVTVGSVVVRVARNRIRPVATLSVRRGAGGETEHQRPPPSRQSAWAIYLPFNACTPL